MESKGKRPLILVVDTEDDRVVLDLLMRSMPSHQGVLVIIDERKIDTDFKIDPGFELKAEEILTPFKQVFERRRGPSLRDAPRKISPP